MKKQINKNKVTLDVIVPDGFTMQDKTQYKGIGKMDFNKDRFTFLIPEELELSRVGSGGRLKNPVVYETKIMRFRQQPGGYERGTIILKKETDLDDVDVRKELVRCFSVALKTIASRRRMEAE